MEILAFDKRRITVTRPSSQTWKLGDAVEIETATEIYLGELQALDGNQAVVQAKHRVDLSLSRRLQETWAEGSFD